MLGLSSLPLVSLSELKQSSHSHWPLLHDCPVDAGCLICPYEVPTDWPVLWTRIGAAKGAQAALRSESAWS